MLLLLIFSVQFKFSGFFFIKIRKNHKRMSCRKMYVRVKDHVPVGRDIFEQIGFANGFKLQIIRSKQRTTWATKLDVFENLLEGNSCCSSFSSSISFR